jgi:hypothetical protein
MTILAAATAGASPERQQGDYYVSPSRPPSPVFSPRRSTVKISDQSLPSREDTTLWLASSDDRDSDDIQTAETGEAYEADDYHDDPATPRWRYRLIMATAAIALAGLGVVSAFAYRAVSAGAVLPALLPIVKAEDAPNENIQKEGDNRPSDLNQTSVASAGSTSEEFVSRFPADNQEPPKTAPISPPMATAPVGPPPSVAPAALAATSLPPKAPPVSAPSSATRKKINTVISRSDGSGKTDTSAATAKAKPSAAAALKLAPDVAATAPEAKQAAAAALPVGRPLSLAPDAHDHSAASSPFSLPYACGYGG